MVLAASIKNLQGDDFTLLPAAYHTQQAAEKALKAFLVFHKITVPKVHNLEFLVLQCSKIDNSFSSLQTLTTLLTTYGTDSRYPDDYIELDRLQVEDAIQKAKFIVDFVKQRLPR